MLQFAILVVIALIGHMFVGRAKRKKRESSSSSSGEDCDAPWLFVQDCSARFFVCDVRGIIHSSILVIDSEDGLESL